MKRALTSTSAATCTPRRFHSPARHHSGLALSLLTALLFSVAGTPAARASIAYGSINNFDTVNDTGKECHGFEIELDDIHSTDITYTYNYNHYGVPEITEDNSVAGHPKVFIRWQSKKNADGTWAAYTAIPAAPIPPTQGHQFTNPAVNFGGEHFGVGYTVQPSAVLYNWLVDSGSGTLVHGGAVQVSTPTFTYYPPAVAAPAQVQAVIAPPPPPAPPPKEFGNAVWMKEIKTTTHNASKVKLRDLVSDDPGNPNDKNWKNGEPDEVETEWRILQKKTSAADGGPNNKVPAAAEALPNGNEVVTRRYEFYKYTGPLDAETGEAMATAVGPDGQHGSGSATYADHFDAGLGEWATVTTDMATKVVVGDFTGAQMAAVDVNAAVGLIDHTGEGKVGKAFAPRTVVVEGALPFTATKSGTVPPGLSFNEATGVLSGTPSTAGTYSFSVIASDGVNPDVQKNYTMNITPAGAAAPAQSLLDTAAAPVGMGTTTGDGSFNVGDSATVTATPAAGCVFLNWTDNGQVVSVDGSYTLTMDVNHSLVANFAPMVTQWSVTTSAAPAAGGTTAGDGLVDDGTSTTVTATANAGYGFTNWTEGGTIVSTSASYTFDATADRVLVANFSPLPSFTVSTSAAPAAGGTTSGDGGFVSGTSTTVAATANAGYFFVNWTENGAQVSTSASYTFNVTANRTLVANFAVTGSMLRTISTSVTPANSGTTTGSGSYGDGTSVTVVATAAPGYKFSKWKQGGSNVSSAASYTFTASADRALVATFTPVYYITGTSNPPEGGTTEADSASYNPGDGGNIIARPTAGWQFVNWTENGNIVGTGTTLNFGNVQANHGYVANFALTGGVNIATSAGPAAAGTTSGGGSYLIGDSVTVSAMPNAGYAFVNWTSGGTVVSSDASYTFTASVNRTLVANFATANSIVTSSAPAVGGSTTGGGAYASGTNVTVTATPNAGYAFLNWTDGAAIASTSATYSFTASTGRTLVAHFVAGYTISAAANPSFAGSINGAGIVDPGASVTLSATANAGYTFVNWTDATGTEVSSSASYTFTANDNATLTANFAAAPVTIDFDFDTAAPVPAVNDTLPLPQTKAGYTATFSSPAAANAFKVSTEAASGRVLSKFDGNYLEPLADNATLVLQFNLPITGVSIDFATVEALNVDVPSNVQITAYDTSSGTPVSVGTGIAHGTVTAGDTLPVGTINFNSTGGAFDQIVLQLPAAPVGALRFLVDNIQVSPASSTGGALTLANPNWNITLSDFGYSDFLLDNTPGFVGREYLSGEWGSAVAYQRNGQTQSPTWLDPNFLYPDWQTNSNFHVVTGIHLVGSNVDGLPIAESVVSNDDLEITLRFEMVDTVVGTPMGVTPASAANAVAAINSNRYVMNQTFSVKNVSGVSITNLQLFQLLHGFISQHGQYDNRSYTGKLSEYRYDATMSGVDGNAAGDQSSSIGLEDLIGFHSKVAPTAFEIGSYGTEGNGVDDHVSGKPSDGVHLSIENNWQSGPYTGRKGRDSFAPANRWIAGGQRWDLGDLAAGQSVNFDIVLSLLTGTKVVVTGGGSNGTGGGGSCNGGSGHVGGVDFEFDGISQEGTFFGEYSDADDAEMAEREAEGEFAMPTVQTPSATRRQLWKLNYNGVHTGSIKLKFAYDPSLLPAGYDENQLVIYHFRNGTWEKLSCKVDTANNIIQAISPSLSPFVLGVNDVVVKPQVEVSASSPGTLNVSWPDSFTGWILQEAADLNPASWINSTRPITAAGGYNSVVVPISSGARFFRLLRP
ncbi:InlB B-repeat-containing protein [Prosthecobacter sp.]|uniref:InlB B-repeat-containing protein n=1 Tax=Prosthecobacter sp. TaxID=1965333 RepID=UPI0037847E76